MENDLNGQLGKSSVSLNFVSYTLYILSPPVSLMVPSLISATLIHSYVLLSPFKDERDVTFRNTEHNSGNIRNDHTDNCLQSFSVWYKAILSVNTLLIHGGQQKATGRPPDIQAHGAAVGGLLQDMTAKRQVPARLGNSWFQLCGRRNCPEIP